MRSNSIPSFNFASSKMEENMEVAGMSRLTRHIKPTHYIFKIQSFSTFAKNSVKNFESNVFESGGYKWKLVLDANERDLNGKDSLALSVVIAETDSLPSGWEVNVLLGLFTFDQLRDKYVTPEDNGDRIRRFHALKKEWGYSQLISVASFKDPSNGYLVNDACIFGAEVFVCKNPGRIEVFSPMDNITHRYTWTIERFSRLYNEHYCSEIFMAGNVRCKIQVYPKGSTEEVKNKFISAFLIIDDFETSPSKRLNVTYVLRAKDHFVGNKPVEIKGSSWFTSSQNGWGSRKFMDLNTLYDSGKYSYTNDDFVVEALVTVSSTAVINSV